MPSSCHDARFLALAPGKRPCAQIWREAKRSSQELPFLPYGSCARSRHASEASAAALPFPHVADREFVPAEREKRTIAGSGSWSPGPRQRRTSRFWPRRPTQRHLATKLTGSLQNVSGFSPQVPQPIGPWADFSSLPPKRFSSIGFTKTGQDSGWPDTALMVERQTLRPRWP